MIRDSSAYYVAAAVFAALFHSMRGIPMDKLKLTAIALVAFGLFVAYTPTFEESLDVINFDQVVTRVCFKRAGFNFVQRWSCRSSLRQIGPVGLAAGCTLGKAVLGVAADNDDVCQSLEDVTHYKEKLKAGPLGGLYKDS